MKSKYIFPLMLASIAPISLLSSCGEDAIPVYSYSIANPFKSTYGRGEVIDFSSLEIEIKSSAGEISYLNGLDSRVQIVGGDTETLGSHAIQVSIDSFSQTFTYNVVEYTLTLDFNGGSYNNQTSLAIPFYKNQADISSYMPVKESDLDNKYAFSGWYYDPDLTSRVSFTIDGIVDSSSSLTLYAGYDLDFSRYFDYTINKKTQEATLVSLNFDNIGELMALSSLEIPATVEGYPITEIGSNFLVQQNYFDVFEGTYTDFDYSAFLFIEEIDFASNSKVKKIGGRAFNGLNTLRRVNLPSSLEEVGDYAFSSCALEGELAIPASVTKLGKEAFAYGSGILEKVTFEENSKTRLIQEGCFASSNFLFSITLPDSLEELRADAFAYCDDLSSINIPKKLKTIDSAAFSNMTSLTNFEIDPENAFFTSIDGNLYSKDETKLIRYCYGAGRKEFTTPPNTKEISNNAFDSYGNATPLRKLTINEGVTYIGKSAFADCSFSLSLPSTLTSFSLEAFKNYEGHSLGISKDNKRYVYDSSIIYSKDHKTIYYCLPDFETSCFILPNNVAYVARNAFLNCAKILSFVIPSNSSLALIGKNGIPVTTMKSLKYLRLESDSPIVYDGDSFGLGITSCNSSYLLDFASESIKGSFISKIGDYAAEASAHFVSFSSALEDAKNKLSSILETSYSSFLLGATPVLSEPFELLSSNIIEAYTLLDYIYLNDLASIDELNYFFCFEKQLMVSIYYQTTTGLGYMSTYALEAQEIRFHNLPSSFQTDLKGLKEKIDGYYCQIDEGEELDSLYSDILSFDVSRTSFDEANYQKLKAEMDKAYLPYRPTPIGVERKIYLLDVSSKIYQLLNFDLANLTSEEFDSICDIVYDREANNFYGLESLISSFFQTEHRREDIYRYDDYCEFKEDFGAIYASKEEEVRQAMIGFDASTYDENRYMSFMSNEYELIDSQFTSLLFEDELALKLNKILAICDMALCYNYSSNEISDSNVYQAYSLIASTESYHGDDILDDEAFGSLPNYSEYAFFKTKVDAYLSSYLSNVESLISSFEISEDNLTSDSVNKLYEKVDILKEYGPELLGEEVCKGETYYQRYCSIILSQIVKITLSTYSSVTEENKNLVKAFIYGYYNEQDLTRHDGADDYFLIYSPYLDSMDKILNYDKYQSLINSLGGEGQ